MSLGTYRATYTMNHVGTTLVAAACVLLAVAAFGDGMCVDAAPVPFSDGVGVDAALSWISSPGRFDCPAAYSNESYRYVADLMAECGFRHVRERLSWSSVAPERDVWKPGRYLANAQLLRNRGMSVSGMFHDAAKYALPKPKLPRDLAATFAFCKALAETFGDRMEIWEFWNEPDIGFTSEGAWDCAAAFKAASLGFRAGGFKGAITPGALCREDRGDYERTLWRNGIAPYADAMNFHLYCAPAFYGARLGELRRFMADFGVGDMAILLTECGTNQEGDATDDGPREGLKRHSALQEAVQEEFAVKSQILSRMEGTLRNYFFVFGAFNERNGEKDWGIMRRDGTLKPAAAALRLLLDEVGVGILAGEVAVEPVAQGSGCAVRAFRFDMPDGTVRLAYWRRTELDDGGETVRKWDDTEVAAVVRLDDGSAFPLRARRRPQFAALPQGRSVALLRPARPIGRLGAAPAPGADLSVVLRADFDKAAASLGGNKSVLMLNGNSSIPPLLHSQLTADAVNLTLQAWNLSSGEKRGRIVFDGRGAVEGLPEGEVTLPPMGKAEFRLRFAVAGEDDPLVSFAADFGSGRATPFVMPVFSEGKFRAACDVVTCAVSKSARWAPHSSAKSVESVWDEAEGAMRFSFHWENTPSDRWLFPGYTLDLPREALDGARLIAFRVKSRQDKVENDWKSARVIFRHGGEGGETRQFMCSAPTHDWETKYVEITEEVRRMGATALGIGGHPKGRQVDLWIKDIRIFRDKCTTMEEKQ